MIGKIHLWGGLFIVVVFFLTGLYLDEAFSVRELANQPMRYMYRANHVYVLLSGLLNVAVGIHFSLHPSDVKKAFQCFGSLLLVSAPGVLLYAFFHETEAQEAVRFFTGMGIFLLFFGTLFQLPGIGANKK